MQTDQFADGYRRLAQQQRRAVEKEAVGLLGRGRNYDRSFPEGGGDPFYEQIQDKAMVYGDQSELIKRIADQSKRMRVGLDADSLWKSLEEPTQMSRLEATAELGTLRPELSREDIDTHPALNRFGSPLETDPKLAIEAERTKRAEMTTTARERLQDKKRRFDEQQSRIKNDIELLKLESTNKNKAKDIMIKANALLKDLSEQRRDAELAMTDRSVLNDRVMYDAFQKTVNDLNSQMSDIRDVVNTAHETMDPVRGTTKSVATETPKATPKPEESSEETYYLIPNTEGGTNRVKESEVIRQVRESDPTRTDEEIRVAIKRFLEKK